MAAICILAILTLPALARGRGSRCHKGTQCIVNLKQTALAALLWANDREEPFPWEIPAVRKGTPELVSSQAFLHFKIMSNELSSPKILICPLEKSRRPGDDFPTLSNQNLSYFVNLAARFSTNDLATPLFGDRNLTGGSLSNDFVRTLSSTNGLGWSKELHQHFGNVALIDGSVTQVGTQALHELVRTSTIPPRLALP